MKRNCLSLLFTICTIVAANTAYARFLQVDTKAEKYPHISPYVSCDNNPLKYVDPDGREKILGVTKKETGYNEIQRYSGSFGVNNPAIHIWGHGDAGGIMLGGTKYTKPTDFQTYLKKNSENWVKRGKEGFAMIVLHSCKTGEGDKSFAQKISEDKDFENVLIVAPSNTVSISNDGNTITESVSKASAKGLWLMFLNGERVSSFDGNTKPYLNEKNQKDNLNEKLKSTGETKTADDHANQKTENK